MIEIKVYCLIPLIIRENFILVYISFSLFSVNKSECTEISEPNFW